LAFSDFAEMAQSPDIDAVAVVVRVPMHRDPTLAALASGKHVYTEWPLGKSTVEAREIEAAAREAGVRHMIGLQSRFSPTLRYARDLIQAGEIGEVLTANVSGFRFQKPADHSSAFTWRTDIREGQNQLSIQTGHVLDSIRYVLGDFGSVRSLLSAQTPDMLEVDTGVVVHPTAPDHVLLSGRLNSGVVISVHVAAVRWAGTGFRMELYGREGTMVLTNALASQRGELTRLRMARGSNDLVDVPVPAAYLPEADGFPHGDPMNVGLAYSEFAAAIREQRDPVPDFAEAVDLHELLDTILASDANRSEAHR
jgi:predicted dehydrogenase